MAHTRKIRFIEPRSREGRPFNAWIRHWPLLGPITLATILHERGFDAGIYNENISGPVEENRPAYQDICSADVVGISIMTSTAMRGYTLAGQIRRDAPQATIVFGGVHATFMPEEALAYGDLVVCGEGESVIEAIARGEIRQGIIQAQPLQDLDAIPTLNHFLLRDFDRVLIHNMRRASYELPVMTSRGCPSECTYCSVARMFGRRVRRQSLDKAYRDLCRYYEQGFRHFFFYDDNFTADRKWTRELLERLGPMNIRFNAQTRVDFPWQDAARTQLDKPLLRAMNRAGGDVLYIGYETIDQATATQWHKGYRGTGELRDRLKDDTKVLHDSGFWIHAMFVMGPQHTPDTADQILQFARQSKIETLQISILTPMPGTPLFQEMRPHLLFTDFPADWDLYDGAHCVYGHSQMGLETLQRTVLSAHRRYYRWCGWSLPRVRAILRSSDSLPEKLAMLWTHYRIVRTTMTQWRDEMKRFLESVRLRTAGDAQTT